MDCPEVPIQRLDRLTASLDAQTAENLTGIVEAQERLLSLYTATDQLLPNTPSKKATFGLTYAGVQGLDANLTVKLVDGYQWAAGVFQGYVPSNEFVDLSAGYRINNYIRVQATATNLLDQQRFQIYGGSVLGRRVLGGLTAQF